MTIFRGRRLLENAIQSIDIRWFYQIRGEVYIVRVGEILSVQTSSVVMKPIIGLILLLFFGDVLCADNVVFESGAKKVQLLELFTSEGCSSCPPAEASLGRLVNDPRLWHEFVPVAFHVDYWDRLGWKDPFASAEWTKRQRLYAANWNA